MSGELTMAGLARRPMPRESWKPMPRLVMLPLLLPLPSTW